MASYLTTRGYGDASSLNVKQLVNSGLSGRDFQNIMTFLLRRFDPTFHSTPAAAHGNSQRSNEVVLKFEEEVSMAFRCPSRRCRSAATELLLLLLVRRNYARTTTSAQAREAITECVGAHLCSWQRPAAGCADCRRATSNHNFVNQAKLSLHRGSDPPNLNPHPIHNPPPATCRRHRRS